MAIQQNDPYRSGSGLSDDEILRRRTAQYDNELRDSEIQRELNVADGPASGGRLALFAVAFIAILGVVFYGLNNSPNTPQSTPTAQTTPATPPAGQTTGSATGSSMTPSSPAQPAPPPAVVPPAPAPSTGTSPAPSNN